MPPELQQLLPFLGLIVVAVACGLVARHIMARYTPSSQKPQFVLEPGQEAAYLVDEDGTHWLQPLPEAEGLDSHQTVRILAVAVAPTSLGMRYVAFTDVATQVSDGKAQVGAIIYQAMANPDSGFLQGLEWWRHSPWEKRLLLPAPPLVIPVPAFDSGALPPQDFTVTL